MAKRKTKMQKRVKREKGKGNSSLACSEVNFSMLPEDCIAEILARTNPQDTCRTSTVATIFLSVARSDALWERFLPLDYSEILHRSAESSRLHFLSKRDLFFSLCDSPLLIDGGQLSFWLEKKSGKKCYMLGARKLKIIRGNNPKNWMWPSTPASRFSEVAYLLQVRRLEIVGKINSGMLSPGTKYAAYLVFNNDDCSGFEEVEVVASIGIVGSETKDKTITVDWWDPQDYEPEGAESSLCGYEYPKLREDKYWVEVEIGEFFNGGPEEDVELEMTVMQWDHNWKHGLVVEGIEIRPKVHP